MDLLQELPGIEQFTSILLPVLGDEDTGTGVAGVLKLLQGIDTGGISSSLLADLDQTVSSDFALDSTALTGGALEQFQQVMISFPNNPASLSESCALVTHRVPDLPVDYFQDMGTVPNTIVIEGTKHGGEARDSFLESIRGIFKAGESTTFVADINTATDLSGDSPAAQRLASAHGLDPSELIPTDQDASLVLDPDSPFDTPPTVLLRREVLDDPTG